MPSLRGIRIPKWSDTSIRKWTDTGDSATSGYLSVEVPKVTGMIELEDIMNANQVVSTGSQFWKRVMQTMHIYNMYTAMKDQWDALVKEAD